MATVSVPRRCGISRSTSNASATPDQAAIRKAVSDCTKKKRLGDARNGTASVNRATGSNPRSPRSGTNWFAAAANPTR
jgi:hypothetical protein